MNPKRTQQSVEERWLTIEEVRIVSDLRIMHSKVDELYQVVNALKRRHNEGAIIKYADQPVLTEDIQKVDEIYLWFVKLKEEAIAQRSEIR
jgi:ATP-dependent RNA circularization protein (DNA/RNA ligase family)